MFAEFMARGRILGRPAARFAREVSARLELAGQRGTGPLAVFLPSGGREGAALLRVYALARRCPDHGWRALVLPRGLTLAQRHRLIAAAEPDLLVMQGARHALNRPWLYPGHRIVFDMDDADFHLPHLAGPLARAMPGLAAVVAGSDYVADWCRSAGAPVAHTVLTGMPVSPGSRPPQAGRPPVVAWAQTRPRTYVREAELVREVMGEVARRRPDVRLRLYDRRPGDDPSFKAWFEAAGIATEWVPAMPLADYLASFDDVALGLAPLCPETPFSRGKSVGKVLAYLDRHVPVIASDAGEHGRVFDAASGVVSNDPGTWVARALGLLDDPGSRQSMADAGFETFRTRFSDAAFAKRVTGILDTHLAENARAGRGALVTGGRAS